MANLSFGPKKPAAAPAPAQAPSLSPVLQQGLGAVNSGGQSYNGYNNLSADHWGVIQEGIGKGMDKNPYWGSYLKDLTGNKLQGQPTYFSQNYAELKKGEDAIAKQAQIEKQLAAAQYGQQQQNMQAGLAGAGLGKSGFAGQEFSDLAAQENMAFSNIYNSMLDRQQNYGQGLKDRWQGESMMRKEERAGKKNRRNQIISTGLMAGGMIAAPMLAPATLALNQA